MMKVLFTDKHNYHGKVDKGYVFEDVYGSLLIVDRAKLVNKSTDEVIFFHKSHNEDIEYSYATQERLGVRRPSGINHSG